MRWRTLIAGIALFAPASILATVGIVELRDGSAIDGAFPVPDYLSTDRPLPKAAYIYAVGFLADADIGNGNAQISRAEAMLRAEYPAEQTRRVMEKGLKMAPSSAEGWVYYARILAGTDPEKADFALDQAFTIAPNEYFLAPMRAQLAAQIWPYLSDRTKTETLQQARKLWNELPLRPGLIALSMTADGASLITRAYAADPGTIRAINRWMRDWQRNPVAQAP
jgi:hypothetical protein